MISRNNRLSLITRATKEKSCEKFFRRKKSPHNEYIIRERKTRTGLTPYSIWNHPPRYKRARIIFVLEKPRRRSIGIFPRNYHRVIRLFEITTAERTAWRWVGKNYNRSATCCAPIIPSPPRAGKHAKIVAGFRLDLDNRGMGIVCFTVLIAEI